jgi:Holliday junction resolvasome RuvABC ATP-dependent DNA helicase subunit
MLDLNTLSVFTPENGIYGGVNNPNFKSIELWMQTIKENPKRTSTKPNNLGLFGPASTGKTTAAGVIAKNLGQPLVSLNCAAMSKTNFWEDIYTTAVSSYPNSHIHAIATPMSRWDSSAPIRTYILQCCTILLDECHELSNRTQGQLLSILDGSTPIVSNAIKGYPLGMTNITWIFSTTDSGKLLYPLSTRLYSVVLNEYTEHDVVEIVKLNYPLLTEDAALVLSRTAKLVPRIALDLAKQYLSIFKHMGYNRETALTYVKSVKQTNEYGLDGTDEKILSMLKESRNTLPKTKQLDKNLVVMKLNKFDLVDNPSEAELTEAINLQKTLDDYEQQEANSPHMPRSRQDISTYCRLYDMRDLETRLGYMEKLGVVAKTKSGIVWKKDVV